MTTSDWLTLLGIVATIIDIVVTGLIGYWIATTIQKNFAQTRALKEYFISELTSLQSDYREFLNQILESKLSAKNITNTLKILSTRIDTIDKFIHKKYELNNSLIKEAHSNFQIETTSLEELNEQYSEPTISLSDSNKTALRALYNTVSEAIAERVIDINEAKCKKNSKRQ